MQRRSAAVPQVIHGVHGYWKGEKKAALEVRLLAKLSAHSKTISDFDQLPLISFSPDRDFTDEGRLRSDAPSVTPFIKHL